MNSPASPQPPTEPNASVNHANNTSLNTTVGAPLMETPFLTMDFSYLNIKDKAAPIPIHRPRRNSLDDCPIEVPPPSYQPNNIWENLRSTPRVYKKMDHPRHLNVITPLPGLIPERPLMKPVEEALHFEHLLPPDATPITYLSRTEEDVSGTKYVIFDENDGFLYPVRRMVGGEGIPSLNGNKRTTSAPPTPMLTPTPAPANATPVIDVPPAPSPVTIPNTTNTTTSLLSPIVIGCGEYFVLFGPDRKTGWLSRGGSREWKKVEVKDFPNLEDVASSNTFQMIALDDPSRLVLIGKGAEKLYMFDPTHSATTDSVAWKSVSLLRPPQADFSYIDLALIMPNERYLYIVCGKCYKRVDEDDTLKPRQAYQIDIPNARIDTVVRKSTIEDELRSICRGTAFSKHNKYIWLHSFHGGVVQQWLPTQRLDLQPDSLLFISALQWCYIYGKDRLGDEGFLGKLNIARPTNDVVPISNMHVMVSSCRVAAACRFMREPRVCFLLDSAIDVVVIDLERRALYDKLTSKAEAEVDLGVLSGDGLERPTPEPEVAKVISEYVMNSTTSYTGWSPYEFAPQK